jgi:2-polyprenyl-3-methyl-5-hydroxy-6-metoxy-1,4-benzoquinol methylase
MSASKATRHDRAWEDWGAVDPLYAILTDPKYRHGGGDRMEFLATGETFAASVVQQCEALGLARERARALDFGCGVGRVTAPLADVFDQVVGLDISESMVAAARRLHAARANCSFEVQRTSDLRGHDDGSFDLVLCVLVLQHMATRQGILGYLAEFSRVLRPGGALVVQLPSSVPPPTPPASLRTVAGRRTRAARFLRRLGVSPKVLYERLDWVPEMTMTAVPDALTRATLAEHGTPVVFTTPPDVDRGGTESRIYFAGRPPSSAG